MCITVYAGRFLKWDCIYPRVLKVSRVTKGVRFRDRLRWGRPGSLTSLDLTSWQAAGVQWTQLTSWGNNLVSTRGRSNLMVSQSYEHLVDWLVRHPTSLTKMVRDLWKEIGPGPITQTQEQRQKQIYCQKPDRLSCTEKSSSHSLLNVIFYR